MVDVFEQVEEELRSDRYTRLARTWLPVVGGILLIALIAALAWWGWDSWQNSKADKASVAYEAGLESLQTGENAKADVSFTDAVKQGNAAYRSMALQQRAGIAITAQKFPEALAFLDEAAKADGDPQLADVARYKAALLVMNTGASLEDVTNRLQPLLKKERFLCGEIRIICSRARPMQPFAQEALAMAQLQHGKTVDARSTFVLLTLGQDVPDALRQNAQNAIAVIDAGGAPNIQAIIAAQKALPQAPPPTPDQLRQAAQQAQLQAQLQQMQQAQGGQAGGQPGGQGQAQ